MWGQWGGVWEYRGTAWEENIWAVESSSTVLCSGDQRRGNFFSHQKACVISRVSSTSVCFFGCGPFSLKQRMLRNQALSKDSSYHLTSPRPRIQRPGCCKFLRVCYISPQQRCLLNINGMLIKWSVFAKVKDAKCTTQGCRLTLILSKGPSEF